MSLKWSTFATASLPAMVRFYYARAPPDTFTCNHSLTAQRTPPKFSVSQYVTANLVWRAMDGALTEQGKTDAREGIAHATQKKKDIICSNPPQVSFRILAFHLTPVLSFDKYFLIMFRRPSTQHRLCAGNFVFFDQSIGARVAVLVLLPIWRFNVALKLNLRSKQIIVVTRTPSMTRALATFIISYVRACTKADKKITFPPAGNVQVFSSFSCFITSMTSLLSLNAV